jgi:hypothetical protein
MRRATALLIAQCKISTSNMALGGQQSTVEITCQEQDMPSWKGSKVSVKAIPPGRAFFQSGFVS